MMPPPTFPSDQGPELLRALLIAAREERDEQHQQLLDAQAFINSIITNPVYRAVRRGARLLRGGARANPDTESAVAEPAVNHRLAPTQPGALLVDCGSLDESMRSGISRVTIRLFQELHRTAPGSVNLVRAVDGTLVRDLTYEDMLIGADTAPSDGGSPDSPDVASGSAAPPRQAPSSSAPPPPQAPAGLISARVTPLAEADSWWAAVETYRRQGGHYLHVVHDLLPIVVPEFFDRNLRNYFPQWLGQVLDHADVVMTDSQATSDDLIAWSDVARPDRELPPVRVLPLGADLTATARLDRDPPVSTRSGNRTVLVVGTIEPRKGVEAVIDAAESLGDASADVEIVLVGARGWIGPGTLARLEAADAGDLPVRWVRDVDDAALVQHYADADLLLAPSRAEGYGLPVVEALGHGVPVLARDIPVFQEICGNQIAYFATDAELPAAILDALANPRPVPAPPHSWGDTASAVIAELRGEAARPPA